MFNSWIMKTIWLLGGMSSRILTRILSPRQWMNKITTRRTPLSKEPHVFLWFRWDRGAPASRGLGRSNEGAHSLRFRLLSVPPLIHIADATGKRIRKKWLQTVWLLGTRFTMEQDFYKGKLLHEYGLNVLIPSEDDRQVGHDIIYNELCLWQIRSESKQKYITIIENLVKQGAEWIILGCTEIPLLIEQKDIDIPPLRYDSYSCRGGSRIFIEINSLYLPIWWPLKNFLNTMMQKNKGERLWMQCYHHGTVFVDLLFQNS